MEAPPENLCREDLDRFAAWFGVVNAHGPPVRQASLYKRLRKRVSMLREDRATPDTQAVPAVRATKWTAIKQTEHECHRHWHARHARIEAGCGQRVGTPRTEFGHRPC